MKGETTLKKPSLIKVNKDYDGGPYHMETSPLICSANQWTGFYIVGTSVMKELKIFRKKRDT